MSVNDSVALLKKYDPEIGAVVEEELERQRGGLEPVSYTHLRCSPIQNERSIPLSDIRRTSDLAPCSIPCQTAPFCDSTQSALPAELFPRVSSLPSRGLSRLRDNTPVCRLF